MTNNVIIELLIAMIKPVTLNDLPIIKCVCLDVFLVNYNMIKLKTCKTKKNIYFVCIICNLAIVIYYRTLWTIPFSRHSGSISMCYVRQWLKYIEWIWRFEAREVKKVKSFTSERFRVSNLIKHVTLRIKVKKKYSECIWRFEAREGKKVKYVFVNTTAQREKS